MYKFKYIKNVDNTRNIWIFSKSMTVIQSKEFKVNDYITLKLEDGKTNIYADGELFN